MLSAPLAGRGFNAGSYDSLAGEAMNFRDLPRDMKLTRESRALTDSAVLAGLPRLCGVSPQVRLHIVLRQEAGTRRVADRYSCRLWCKERHGGLGVL